MHLVVVLYYESIKLRRGIFLQGKGSNKAPSKNTLQSNVALAYNNREKGLPASM